MILIFKENKLHYIAKSLWAADNLQTVVLLQTVVTKYEANSCLDCLWML